MSDVGEKIIAGNSNWSFKGKVAKNFSRHIKKSVPLYEEGHNLICRISDFFVPDDSVCYELGMSNGNLIQKLAKRHQKKKVKFIGLDSENDMVEIAKKKLKKINNVSFYCKDITNYKFDKADLIISYYTIQFVSPRKRQELIDKIYNALNWGGAFIMFEKTRGNDARFQDIWTAIYSDFKLEQGYSPEEIMNKSRSLKGILEPFSMKGNLDMLKRAGFIDIATIFKYVPFAGFISIK